MQALVRVVPIVILATAFVLSGLTHDVVPHEHGHSESAIWQQLHSGIRHEDKKTILLPFIVTVISIFSLIALIKVDSIDTDTDPLRGRYLAKGIAPYRRFT